MSQTAFIFPGQGAQEPGMAKDFYENSASAREVFDQAESLLGLDMKKLCFEENEELNITEYTQIALLTTCMAMERVVREQGLAPQVTAGLSLGEYCAIVSAGGMELSDAMRLVRKRGILMQEAVPAGEGSMAAVLGMDGPSIEKVLEGRDGVWIANYNCPGQIVITGYKAPVEEASKALQEAGAKRVLPLKVSGPFHSPLMNPAGEGLKEVFAGMKLSSLELPYVTNVTAEYVNDIGQTEDLLIRQVSSSVRWQQSVEAMIAAGVDTFVEIGPGRTLTGFLRKIDRQVKGYNIRTWDEMQKVCEELAK
ncbi:MAG TPA: ACP S-malonyltransferase [Candidatus Fusicatenibacter merdavium]|uniref:Malonyl CoA-acyl carrier protein transacylase n=1 Tax=Candidatus Fusicatenibacter merdavium TaxID=2838600 RepID=A0A9D1XCW6_9FIRM|nr:ACP S-malonyltransferase [Candidatus Fusicatenibacter merdavium]